MANSWYAYLGENLDPLAPGSYGKITQDPLCINGIMMCVIYLNQTTMTPNSIPSMIRQYIVNGLGTQVAQPAGGGLLKNYIYLKGA